MNIQGITPAMPSPVQMPTAMTAATSASTGSASGTSSSSSTSSSDLQATFLNLLITELQNQDPTSPVDPTQMVGQMVSLNQLDQLISINQTLQSMAPGTSTTSGSQEATGAVTSLPVPQASSLQAAGTAAASPSADSALHTSTPYTGGAGDAGLMNLYGGYGLPTANSQLTQRGGR